MSFQHDIYPQHMTKKVKKWLLDNDINVLQFQSQNLKVLTLTQSKIYGLFSRKMTIRGNQK